MRISTANTYDTSIALLQARQEQLSTTQLQLTSGKRVSKPSDDPTAAARVERAVTQVARSDTTQHGLDASRNAMTLVESALGDADDLLQQAREAVVSAGNGAYSDSDRQTLAQTLSGIRDQLLQIANRSDGNGSYLFGGQNSTQPPFVDMPGGVQFVGTPGQTRIADANLPLTVDGQPIFLQGKTGNGVFETQVGSPNSGSAWIDAGSVTSPAALTGQPYNVTFSVNAGVTTYTVTRNGAPTSLANVPYVAGQAISIDGMAFTIDGKPANGDSFDIAPSSPSLSVFGALDRTIAALKSAAPGGAQQTQNVQFALRDIDSALSNVLAARGTAGEMLNRTDVAGNRNADLKLAGQTERSNAEDLDMMAAISDFQSQQTGYDAALKAYSMVQRLSLFDYLK